MPHTTRVTCHPRMPAGNHRQKRSLALYGPPGSHPNPEDNLVLKAQIVGNLGSDPEIRYTPNGTAVLSFNVASNGRTKSASGEWVDSTEWIRCSVFGDRAEKLSPHLTRGVRIYVDGRLESRPWIDRSNQPRAGLELVADSVEFVSSRERDDAQAPQQRQPVAAGSRYATGSDNVDLEGLPF